MSNDIDFDRELMFKCDVNSFLLDSRRINLYGEIDDDVALDAIEKLQFFSQDNEPVYIYISSDGGYLSAGMSIIEQMQLMPSRVYTIIIGRAYSMGAIIATFGNKGHRFITPSSTFMLHPPYAGMHEDYTDQQKKMIDFESRQEEWLLKEMAKRTKPTKKQLKKMIDKGLWLTADEVIKHGFCDQIWTPKCEQGVNIHTTNARRRKDEQRKILKFGTNFSRIMTALLQGDLVVEEDKCDGE